MVNSSWTLGHIQQLWWGHGAGRAALRALLTALLLPLPQPLPDNSSSQVGKPGALMSSGFGLYLEHACHLGWDKTRVAPLLLLLKLLPPLADRKLIGSW